MENKTDAFLEILSIVPREELKNAEDYLALLGFSQAGNWQILVKYNGDIQSVARSEGGIAQIINNQFAVLTIPSDRVSNLLNYTEIEYMEVPKRAVYTATSNMTASCITVVQNNPPYRLKGEGVLLAIIDSGINYLHPDFRNEDGSTRINYLWDQNISGNPPEGFVVGTQYTREQINEALSTNNRQQALTIVPSMDTVGHGTHVAGIAGGNGRGSNGNIVGAAPDAEFLIVKLGQPDFEGFVRNVEIMLGVRYVLEKARELEKPVSINISLGMNTGPHDGSAIIEQYLDDAAGVWKNNIVVGTGNEANARNHTNGTVGQNETTQFEFQIGEHTQAYSLSVWFNPIDMMAFEIVNPSGRKTPLIVYAAGPVSFIIQNTNVYATFAGPSPLNGAIEFALFLTGTDGAYVTSGPWKVIVHGQSIVNGNFDAWGPTTEAGGSTSYFLNSTVDTTLTTPSTSQLVISVGAYNHVTGQIAPFSGRGFGRNNKVIKPDLVAPGVEITSASHTTSGYRTLSGTSMATPHVTGGVALMMEWGIVRQNNVFLYGENLKTYLIRGATRNDATTYPSPIWGYGRLCVEESLDILRAQLIF